MAEMRTVFISLLILLFFLLFSSSCAGLNISRSTLYSHQKNIDYYDDEAIYAVVCDSKGYWWVGTNRGLLRFDGANTHRVFSGKNEPLSGKKVNRLLLDGETLWLGFLSGGLAKIDLNDYQLNFYGGVTAIDSPGFKGDVVIDMSLDRNGQLWVGTELGLNRYISKSNRFEHIKIEQGIDNSAFSAGVRMAVQDSMGRVWVVTMKHGLLFWQSDLGLTDASEVLQLPEELNASLASPGNVRFVKEKADGSILVLLKGELLLFSKSAKLLKRINLRLVEELGSNRDALGLKLDREENIWVRTDAKGLIALSSDFSYLKNYLIRTSTGHLRDGLQTDLFFSEFGVLAVSNLLGGLDFFNPRYLNGKKLHFFKENALVSRANSVSRSDIFAVVDNGGMILGDKREIKFFDSSGNLEAVVKNTVGAIESTVAWGELWLIAAGDKGFYRVDKESLQLQKERDGFFTLAHYSEKNGLFVISEDGVQRLRKPDGQFEQVSIDFGPELLIGSVFQEDSSGVSWLINRGVPRYFDIESQSFLLPEGADSLSFESISLYGFFTDSHYYGVGDEVKKIELNRGGDKIGFGVIKKVENANLGWPIKNIKVTEGGVWIASRSGRKLSFLRLLDDKVFHFSGDEGFPRLPASRLLDVSHNNQLLISDPAGVYKLELDLSLFPIQKVNISSIRVGNPGQESQLIYRKPNRLTLEPDENFIHVDISDFSHRAKNDYYARYRLRGRSDIWIETSESSLSFSGLSSGVYHLEIQSNYDRSNSDGLEINVIPPWWSTYWAYSFYLLLLMIVVLVFLFLNWDRLRLRRQREAEIKLYSKGFERIDQGVCIVDGSGRIKSKNIAFDILMKSSSESDTGSIFQLSTEKRVSEAISNGWEMLLKVGYWAGKFELVYGGKTVYLEARGFAVEESRSDFMVLITDVTERVRSENNLYLLSTSDDLTGLPNRRHLLKELQARINHVEKSGGVFSVLFLDVDRFKNINDSFGHFFGDQCLQLLAVRLKSCLMEGEFVARLGGDEFVVLSAISKNNVVSSLQDKVLDQVTEPLLVDGEALYISLSVGYVNCPTQAKSTSVLMRMADSAMYFSKEMGGNRATVYADEMSEKPLKKISLENQLRVAVRERQLEVHYQPKIDMSSGRVSGLEALLRWRSEDGALIYPGGFIEVAEETGIIISLGWQVLDLVCRQLNSWLGKGLSLLPVAVNISAKQLLQEDFSDRLNDILKSYSIASGYIEIEVTETAFAADIESVIRQLAVLSERGHSISIDDYGTGYSSLSYIGRLPVDGIKIDQSFVDGIGHDQNKFNIVKNTIALAASLQLKVVAEGVANAEVHQTLQGLKCDVGQGFFYSPALEGDDSKLLKMLSQPNIIMASQRAI